MHSVGGDPPAGRPTFGLAGVRVQVKLREVAARNVDTQPVPLAEAVASRKRDHGDAVD